MSFLLLILKCLGEELGLFGGRQTGDQVYPGSQEGQPSFGAPAVNTVASAAPRVISASPREARG